MQETAIAWPGRGTCPHFPKHDPANYCLPAASGDTDNPESGESGPPFTASCSSSCTRLNTCASGEQTTAAGAESPRHADDDPFGTFQPSSPGPSRSACIFMSPTTPSGRLQLPLHWNRKPLLQELPSRSVAGILQWYKAAVRELAQVRRLGLANHAAAPTAQYSGRSSPEELLHLPTEKDLISWQRQLLVELSSSPGGVLALQVIEQEYELCPETPEAHCLVLSYRRAE
ncbi:hypothetical protein CSUI_002841 [Cystoisospora suis]|uniref:Uncharacterized protein n=1 Tax=Cystoisospora suis TaxID=483139 RepID=A0A2C6L7U8_9APIC|nr:hypothetical protein CSUI_002841 [Cystoisospora suis]